MANHVEIVAEAEKQIRSFLYLLMPYFDDPDTNEIMINRADTVFVERGGSTETLNVKLNDSMIEGAINAVASWNRKSAEIIMDARLRGIRVASVMPPAAVHGPLLSIRKLVTKPQRFSDYLERGDFSHAMSIGRGRDDTLKREMENGAAKGGAGLSEFFTWMMRERKNVVVAGGTTSGKTTLATAFLSEVPSEHRIITCEDTNELVLSQPNVVQLEASVVHGIDLRRLIKACLRLRPDRIIVGEVRGPELFDLLDAANTGHPGTLFTLHANSAIGALLRMEILLRMTNELRQATSTDLRQWISQSVDYIVFQGRSGRRRAPVEVLSVEPVLDADGGYITKTLYHANTHASPNPQRSSS